MFSRAPGTRAFTLGHTSRAQPAGPFNVGSVVQNAAEDDTRLFGRSGDGTEGAQVDAIFDDLYIGVGSDGKKVQTFAVVDDKGGNGLSSAVGFERAQNTRLSGVNP